MGGHKELKKLIKEKSYSQIVDYLLSIENDVEALLLCLKTEEVFVDRWGRGEYDTYIELLLASKLQEIVEHFKEVKIINSIFKEERKLQQSIKKIPKRTRLAQVLWGLNLVYNDTRRIAGNKKWEQANHVDSALKVDGCALLFNATYKSLLYDDEICVNDGFKYMPFGAMHNIFNIETISHYIEMSSMAKFFEGAFKEWKQGFRKFIYNGDKIFIKYINQQKLGWFWKSKSKSQIYDYIDDTRIALEVSDRRLVKHKAFYNFDEQIAWEVLRGFLHTNDIETLVDGISIKDWIKAYALIVRYSQKFKKLRLSPLSTVFNMIIQWGLLANKKERWIDLFVKAGIDRIVANKIFDKMIYSKRSSDLYDFPFVKIKNKYMVIPELLSIAHVGLVLKSRFRQNDCNISKKGKKFEDEIIKIIRGCGVPATQIHRKIGNKEYECDLAFVLNKTLYICECKDNGDKSILDSISDFYVNDVEQLNRIADYFQGNLNVVIDEFKKANYMIANIEKVERFLIYNSDFHSTIDYDGVKIIDYNRFIALFRKGNLEKAICRYNNGPIQYFSGKITDAKFKKYIECNYSILDYEKIIFKSEKEFDFGELHIKSECEEYKPIDREGVVKMLLGY